MLALWPTVICMKVKKHELYNAFKAELHSPGIIAFLPLLFCLLALLCPPGAMGLEGREWCLLPPEICSSYTPGCFRLHTVVRGRWIWWCFIRGTDSWSNKKQTAPNNLRNKDGSMELGAANQWRTMLYSLVMASKFPHNTSQKLRGGRKCSSQAYLINIRGKQWISEGGEVWDRRKEKQNKAR